MLTLVMATGYLILPYYRYVIIQFATMVALGCGQCTQEEKWSLRQAMEKRILL